jgi:hypothetical protein
MRFAFLINTEAEGANVRWLEKASKPPEVINAALAAGFSDWEVEESPVGVLVESLAPTPDWQFKAGAIVLVGMNGSTLIELS